MSRQLAAAVAALLVTGAAGADPASAPDWIGGHWCMERGEEIIEELWLPPHGGVAIGIGRRHSKDRTTAFEYLRIVDVDGVLTYIAQPGGQPPTAFRMTAAGAQWIRFENPGHDFPQRIEYRRDGDTLLAETAGPGADGEERVLSFDYRRCDAPPG